MEKMILGRIRERAIPPPPQERKRQIAELLLAYMPPGVIIPLTVANAGPKELPRDTVYKNRACLRYH